MSRAHVVLPSPIGELTVVAEDGAITHLLMDAAKYRPDDPEVFGDPGEVADEPFAAAGVQLAAYFTGVLTEFDLPLAPRGDDFHQRVWALLREIPYGETRSYGDLARGERQVELGQDAREVCGELHAGCGERLVSRVADLAEDLGVVGAVPRRVHEQVRDGAVLGDDGQLADG